MNSEQCLDKMEVLAPAGNMASLMTAVRFGADAVYLGLKNFNARGKAENFSEEELRLAVSYCHERGVRVYLTFNTLVKTAEVNDAVKAFETAYNCGVDAFLIQDIGLYLLLDKRFPNAVFHASTQMGIHNSYGAIFAQKMGFDRIVTSREVLPEDVKAIKEKANVEVEMFVHGAHCVSFSGNCYFSSLVSGYSGNRGKCLQLCRKKYALTDGKRTKNGYELSAKDICLYDDIELLRSLGVDSLKIEGRLRSDEYVGVCSDVYSRAVLGKKAQYDISLLKTVFNRGDYSHAYLRNDKANNIYDLQQNHIGLNVGSIKMKNGKPVICGYSPKIGDCFKILRKGKEVGKAISSVRSTSFSGRIADGDSVNLTKSGDISRMTLGNNFNENYCQVSKISRKNARIVPDIVLKQYLLPSNCSIIIGDEVCDIRIFEHADVVIFSPNVYSIDIIERFVKNCNKPVLLDLPVQAREKDLTILKNIIGLDIFDGYVANNVYALELCKDKKILLGTYFNSISNLIRCEKISSVESAYPENNSALYAYGKATLMNLTHCPLRQLGSNCNSCKGECVYLIDEMGNKFEFRRRKLHYCYYELLNSKTQNLLPKCNQYGKLVYDVRNIAYDVAEKVLSGKYDFDEKTQTYGRYGKGVK